MVVAAAAAAIADAAAASCNALSCYQTEFSGSGPDSAFLLITKGLACFHLLMLWYATCITHSNPTSNTSQLGLGGQSLANQLRISRESGDNQGAISRESVGTQSTFTRQAVANQSPISRQSVAKPSGKRFCIPTKSIQNLFDRIVTDQSLISH